MLVSLGLQVDSLLSNLCECGQSACKVAGVGKRRSQVLGNSILSTKDLWGYSIWGSECLKEPAPRMPVPAPSPSAEWRGWRGWRPDFVRVL